MAETIPLKTCPEGMKLIEQIDPSFSSVPDFCLKTTAVTEEEYWSRRGSHFTRNIAEQIYKHQNALQETAQGVRPSAPHLAHTHITYQQAQKYCRQKYPSGDIPTFSQWIKADDGRTYCVQPGVTRLYNYPPLEHGLLTALLNQLTGTDSKNVAPFGANQKGIYGMVGGLWEWVRDPNRDLDRGLCGGAWTSPYQEVPEAIRKMHILDRDKLNNYHHDGLGFRCAAPPLVTAK